MQRAKVKKGEEVGRARQKYFRGGKVLPATNVLNAKDGIKSSVGFFVLPFELDREIITVDIRWKAIAEGIERIGA